MLKNLFRLLTALISFLVLLVLPNTANAATQVDNTLIKTGEQTSLQQVNLNIISPSLNFLGQSNQELWDHLGCSCAICTQTNSPRI